MISVPNVNIILRAQNNASSVETRPAIFAEMFRAVWAGRLDPEHGLTIEPIADCTPEDKRYSTFGGFHTIEREIISFFSNGDPRKHADIAAKFNKVFPNGVQKQIEDAIKEDAARATREREKIRSAPTAHPSFVEAGIDDLSALNIQRKGWATVSDIPADSILALVDCGLNPAQASNLLDVASKTRPAAKKPAKLSTLPEPLEIAAAPPSRL